MANATVTGVITNSDLNVGAAASIPMQYVVYWVVGVSLFAVLVAVIVLYRILTRSKKQILAQYAESRKAWDAERKELTSTATKAGGDKEKALKEANETIAKYRERVKNLSGKPAGTDVEALASLESLAAISASMLDALTGQSETFSDTVEGVRATGRIVKGILDIPEKVNGRFALEKAKVDNAVHEMNLANRAAEDAKGDVTKFKARIIELEGEVKKYRDFAESGKISDLRKLAKLQGQKDRTEELEKKIEGHNDQVMALATAAVGKAGGKPPKTPAAAAAK
jgi:chromosome segregation ATPase